MSAGKYTPGPWRLVLANKGRVFNQASIQAKHPRGNVQRIASVNLCAAAQTDQYANARLIAAAPDLLAAAQKALAECCDLAETDAGRALEAEISKATGQEGAAA